MHDIMVRAQVVGGQHCDGEQSNGDFWSLSRGGHFQWWAVNQFTTMAVHLLHTRPLLVPLGDTGPCSVA